MLSKRLLDKANAICIDDRSTAKNDHMKTLKLVRSNFGKWIIGLIVIWVIYLIFFKGNIHFKEEIKLSSGEVIVVDRKFVTASFGEIGGPGGWDAKYNSFEIVSPDRPDNPPIWESKIGLIPVLFDRDPKTNEWFLVTSLFMCSAWKSVGKPKYDYVEFRIMNGRWQQIALSPGHFGKPTNVYTSMRSDGEFWKVTIEVKNLRYAEPKIDPSLKRILLEPSNC